MREETGTEEHVGGEQRNHGTPRGLWWPQPLRAQLGCGERATPWATWEILGRMSRRRGRKERDELQDPARHRDGQAPGQVAHSCARLQTIPLWICFPSR